MNQCDSSQDSTTAIKGSGCFLFVVGPQHGESTNPEDNLTRYLFGLGFFAYP